MPDDEHAPRGRRFLGTTRMEAFSDGVFAIAITLLVLELAIPRSGTALERVLDAWPSYLAYVVSFLTIGAAWLAHTALTDRLTRVDLPLLRLNLVLLLLVAALPFPTRLVAEGIHDVSDERVFVTMYGVALAGIRILLYAVDAYARREHLGPPEAAGEPAGARRSIVTVVLVYGAALLVGLVAPGVAVGAYCAIAVFLVVPFGELRRLLFRHPSLPPIESRGRAPRGDGRASGVTCPVGVDDPDDAGQGPLEWLLEASHTLPPGRLAPAVDEALRRIGARSSLVYVVDHEQTSLHPLPMDGAEHGSFDVDGTTGGRAFMLEETVTIPTDDGVRQWVPLLDGTARLGVVSVDLDPEAADDPATTRLIESCVSLAAELLVSKSQYTDEIECTRRRQAMSLEAELQRCTLPPVALLTPSVAVAGLLLPAYEVAGDSFDYALNEDRLEVAIIDSVGHELESSVISHLVYGSLRNSRRNRIKLPEAYARAGAAVARVFPDIRFATAAFGHLDLASGGFRWISAGHPPPLLVRGGKVTGEAPTRPALPIGLGGTDPPVNEVTLERGDHIFLYTDGATEGGEPGGERFGLDRLVDLLGRSLLDGLPPSETVRRLVQAVFAHSAYRLQDDTTMMLIEYRSGSGD